MLKVNKSKHAQVNVLLYLVLTQLFECFDFIPPENIVFSEYKI